MRLINYLNEGRTKTINKSMAIELLNKHCSHAVNAYKHGDRIYRGVKGFSSSFGIVDPPSIKRVSANTTNYYTLLIDRSPKWKSYPKRSRSIVCATSESESENYGTLYSVFPYNGSKIGICPLYDLWYSFETSLNGNNLLYFNTLLKQLLDTASSNVTDRSFADIKRACKEFDEAYASSVEIRLNVETMLLPWFNNNYKGNLLKMLNELLDPSKNGFKLVTVGDSLPKNNEIWTDGKSILVKVRLFDDIFKKL